eukprot:SAG31_NODE_6127_length_2157_cov_1.805151_2_plen_245_part_00
MPQCARKVSGRAGNLGAPSASAVLTAFMVGLVSCARAQQTFNCYCCNWYVVHCASMPWSLTCELGWLRRGANDEYSCTTNMTGTVQATWETAEVQCATTYPDQCHNCLPFCDPVFDSCDPNTTITTANYNGECGTCLPGTKYGFAQMDFNPVTSKPANCSARALPKLVLASCRREMQSNPGTVYRRIVCGAPKRSRFGQLLLPTVATSTTRTTAVGLAVGLPKLPDHQGLRNFSSWCRFLYDRG